MGYQVLARKWRPRSFAELVGQTHVLQALVNALDQNRLHHAYLFTGTRGVGKTTIARIFAKCLNCEAGVGSTPCGQCSACCEIDEGRFVDLIEVDAASRTRVEDTRELLDNVQYAPTRGRYKVYLIDEVHMLSTHSFNALLKTLEEPPPHVKFLLATTDPQKLPVTILSRCLQFSLKNMTPQRIVGHLADVLDGEGLTYDQAALWQLARAADGSMRDALSLTDQAIAFGNGQVNGSEVSSMLGTIDQGHVLKLVQALASAAAGQVLAAVAHLAEYSPDYQTVLDDMLTLLHRLAIAQAVPEAIDDSQGDREQLMQLAATLSAEEVQLYYQVGLVAKRDLPLAPDPRGGFEMALLRMLAFSPEPVPVMEEGDGAGRDSATAREAESEPEPGLAVVDDSGTTDSVGDASGVASSGDTSRLEASIQPDNSGQSEKSLQLDSRARPGEREQPDNNTTPNDCGQTITPPPPEAMMEVIPLAAYDDPPQSRGPDVPEQPPAAPVEVQVTPVVTGRPVADVQLPEDHKLTLEQLDPAHWVALFTRLSPGGVTGTIGSHCEYAGMAQGQIRLRLDSQRSTLYNDIHRARIEQLLSDYFGRPVPLQVDIGEIRTETPAAWRERKRCERLAQARNSIYADPCVQGLIANFSATVLEQSIVPID